MKVKIIEDKKDNKRPNFAIDHKHVKMYNSMSVGNLVKSQMSGLIKGKNNTEYVFVHIEKRDKTAKADLYLPLKKVFNKKGSDLNVDMLIQSYLKHSDMAIKTAKQLSKS